MKKFKTVRAILVIMATAMLLGCPTLAMDITPPTVSSTVPAIAATEVALNSNITATFSEAVMESTVNATTFLLMAGTTPVAGTVTYVGLVASFDPDINLEPETVYTATITTGVRDLAGNALAELKEWTFTTSSTLDETSPTVVSTVPTLEAVDVALNSNIIATFSEAMAAATLTTTTFTLVEGSTPVAGVVTYSNLNATFNPTANLLASTVYTATISTSVTDLAGNQMANDKVWTFTTGSAADTVAPVINSTNPANGAVEVAVNSNISVVFSESMLPGTVSTSSFYLNGSELVSGTVSYSGFTATFNPDVDLATGTVYTATVTTDMTDLAGNQLISDSVWTFTTVTAGPAGVELLSAANFTILAESMIRNDTTGASSITGNLGLSPANLTYITGFVLSEVKPDGTNIEYATSPEVIDGSGGLATIMAADMIGGSPTTAQKLTTAIGDKLAAYNDAAGRPAATLADFLNVGAGTVPGGTVFVPGLYTWTSALNVTGDITLTGGANDIWIFQIAGTFSIGTGVRVLLEGGATASNIFWQVADQVTIGTTGHVEGIVLCAKDIWLLTGATMRGRAYSAFQVVLQSATMVQPE